MYMLTRTAHTPLPLLSQIEISKSYGQTEWREDLKKITRHAGGEGHPCVFLFSDTQASAG